MVGAAFWIGALCGILALRSVIAASGQMVLDKGLWTRVLDERDAAQDALNLEA